MNKTTNIIGVLVGIIGITLAVYFHYSTREIKEISYHTDTISLKIFDNNLIKDTQKISLYKNDSIKISRNVYLTTFSIWNSGNQPIPAKDIRKNLNVLFEGIDEILDYKIVKNVDPEVSKLKISKNDNSTINISWAYFDPHDGLKVQILYTGKSNIKPIIQGKILLTNFKESIPKATNEDKIYILFMGSIVLLFLGWMTYKFRKKPLKPNLPKITGEGKLLNQNLIFSFLKIARIILFLLFFLYLTVIPWKWFEYFFPPNNIPF